MMRRGWTISLGFGIGMAVMSGCSNLDRSLVFFTHTSVGIEAGVEPTTSSGKILIGYKRAEGVINPVYQPPSTERVLPANPGGSPGPGAGGGGTKVSNPDDMGAEHVYRKEAYSVLAKLRGKTNTNAGTGLNASGEIAQWFATGKAADILAGNEFAPAALTGSDKLAKSIASSKLGVAFNAEDDTASRALLSGISSGLREMAANDPDAKEHADALDELGKRTITRLGQFQNITVASGSPPIYTFASYAADGGDFQDLIQYSDNANTSAELAGRLMFTGTYNKDNGAGGSDQVSVDNAERQRLLGIRDDARDRFQDSDKVLRSSPEVLKAVAYYASNLIKTE